MGAGASGQLQAHLVSSDRQNGAASWERSLEGDSCDSENNGASPLIRAQNNSAPQKNTLDNYYKDRKSCRRMSIGTAPNDADTSVANSAAFRRKALTMPAILSTPELSDKSGLKLTALGLMMIDRMTNSRTVDYFSTSRRHETILRLSSDIVSGCKDLESQNIVSSMPSSRRPRCSLDKRYSLLGETADASIVSLSPGKHFQQVRIVIVDDSPAYVIRLRRLICDLISPEHVLINTFHDLGAAETALLSCTRAGLVFLDNTFPKSTSSGLELSLSLWQSPHFFARSFVVMSGEDDFDESSHDMTSLKQQQVFDAEENACSHSIFQVMQKRHLTKGALLALVQEAGFGNTADSAITDDEGVDSKLGVGSLRHFQGA